MAIPINKLWNSLDSENWHDALEHYWSFVQPKNMELEKSLELLNLERLHSLDAIGWYSFLKNEYFRWKYTTPNRYKTTTNQLDRYIQNDQLEELDKIRSALLSLSLEDIRGGLKLACKIRGLGTAGASGLLALIFPETFATVDQFVVKALRQVTNLAESEALNRIRNPESLSISNGSLLISIMQKKAAENNKAFETDFWTPRAIDKVLWTYGR